MINVIKRSGQICNFDEEKIVTAIESSMRDSIEGIDSELSKQIAKNIKERAHDYITVEEIQNLVEDELMQSKRKDVARSYIIYRQMRNINRDLEKEDNKNKILSDEFLSKYKHLPNPMHQLGSFVYYRTYSRWLNVENRRENWWETVRRAVEYNCSLAPTNKEEAEEIFDNIFNLKQFVSGRTFWIGGTPVSEKFACGNFNCAGELIDNIKAFEDLFYLLMIGSGVGIRLLKEDVEKLPYFKVDFNLINEAYHPIEKRKRTDNTSLIFDSDSKSVAKIIIGDSKEGWVKSLGYFLSLLTDHSFRDIKTIIINYDNVRPKGEKLKTFGGTASGYESIMIMFNKIVKLLKKYNHDKEKVKLKPIDCLDICTMIGENVVVGGVRRTAMVALIDSDDEECIKAKNNLYINNSGNWIINKDIINRQMANNTIVYKEKPSREKLHWQIEQNRYSGEPGFFNLESALKRNPNSKLANPCQPKGEYILTENGFRKIEEIIDHIVLENKKYNSSKMFATGEKEVFEIQLENGLISRFTKNHPISTLNGDIEVSNLKVGDKILVDHIPIFNTIIDNVEEYEKGIILGCFIADGSFSFSQNKYSINFAMGINEFEFSDSFEKMIKKHFNENFHFINTKAKTCKTGRINKKELVEKFINTYDIKNYNKFDVDFYKKSKDFKLGLLKGLFTCDGSTRSSGSAILNSINKNFLYHIQRILLEFGIYSNVTIHSYKRSYIGKDQKRRNNKDCWKIEIYDPDFINIGFLTDYKQKALKEKCKKQSTRIINKKKQLKIKSINSIGIMPVYDISVQDIHHYNSNGFIVHNCMEILLDNKQFCNLTTVNVMGFVDENGVLNKEKLFRAQELSVKMGYRMSLVELELNDWNINHKRDRLTGCSLSGWQDMVNKISMNFEEQCLLLKELREIAKNTIKNYSKELNDKESVCATAIKPDGTISLLAGVSPGVHFSHSPYYIRRIRINANDPLVKVCEELKYPIYPETGQDIETCSTKVIEFPCKAPKGKTKGDVSAIEQLEVYKMFMKNYVDHNVSITVHVRDNEWDLVEQWIWDNWDDIVAVSLLSYSDSFYKLMPYEEITEEEYNYRMNKMNPFIPSLLKKYEVNEDLFDIGNEGCEAGVCPVR